MTNESLIDRVLENCLEALPPEQLKLLGVYDALEARRAAKAPEQPVGMSGIDPLILAAQDALDVLKKLKPNSNIAANLRNEMQIYLRRKAPERESVNLAIAANDMIHVTASGNLPQNTTESYRKLAETCAKAWGLKYE